MEITITESGHITLLQQTEEIVERFLKSSSKLRQNSRDLYRRTLKQFFLWAESRGLSLDTLTIVELIQYREYLLSPERGLTSLTVGSYITSLKKFYEFLESERIYPNIAKSLQNPKRKQQFRKSPLSNEQAKELLEYFSNRIVKNLQKELENLGIETPTATSRDYAIINLILRTGLRTIEVIRANVGDIVIKPGGQRVLLIHGKGRDEKDNFVILTEKTYKPISEYLETRGACSISDPLFNSTSNNSKGGRLTTRTISHIAKEGLRAIGLDSKSFTAHSLRHTAGTSLLRATGDLEKTRLMLRHSDPKTTLIYVDTIEEERRLKESGEAILDTLY
jgi:integrase/recombinase XerC/integrase/recombinase XerD